MSNLKPFCLLLLLICFILSAVTKCRAKHPTATYEVVQQASRDGTTRSVTFLSSGYTEGNRTLFKRDVDTCVKALKNEIDGVISEPWNRYASLLNIYSVFQPSMVSGVGLEMEKRGENNLECVFSKLNLLAVNCNIDAIFSLATAAPARDLLVVLVNEPGVRRGVGGRSLAIFTNNALFMPFFAVRELSKAIAYLADEYSHGLKEEEVVHVPNCVASLKEARRMWGYWIEKGVMSNTSFESCFFNNYYRPTQNNCMMRDSSVNSMCAVCKEQVSLALFTRPSDLFSTSTRCSTEDHIVRVNTSEKVLRLSVGKIDEQPDVKVTWQYENNSIITNNSKLELVSDLFNKWTFPTTINAVISDDSPYVRPAWHGKILTRTIKFLLVKNNSPYSSKECELNDDAAVCGENDCTTVTLPSLKTLRRNVDKTAENETKNGIILAAVCCGVAFLAVLLLLFLYFKCYCNRPHEVFSIFFMDNLIQGLILFFIVVVIGLVIYALIWTVRYLQIYAALFQELLIPIAVLLVVIYVVAHINFASVLFRCYILTFICAVIFFVIGLAFIGTGVFLICMHLLNNTNALTGYMAKRWNVAVKNTPFAVDNLQVALNCSGFFVHCLQVNASTCPADGNSNMYADSCEKPFMEKVQSFYIPGGLYAVVGGILLLLLTFLDITFSVRFLNRLKAGRRRRMYHNDAHALLLPLTLTEARVARRIFNAIADKHNKTLNGRDVSSFLEKIFKVELEPKFKYDIEHRGPLTYDEVMLSYFPYLVTTRTDPRQLVPDEAQRVKQSVDLQLLQYKKLNDFVVASGVLSPEALYKVFERYMSNRFLVDHDELICLIKKEAETNSTDLALYGDLTPFELEGLRGAWVALHPEIVGELTDEQIDLFYQWLHGERLHSPQQFKEWKKTLDVRGCGKIGWDEFCYPFAKNALLSRARDTLARCDKDIPPEIVKKSFVVDRFGMEVATKVFLPYEDEIPIERLVKHFLPKRWTVK